MSIRNILLPVANRPECLLAMDKATALARDLGANLTGCHVVPDPHDRKKEDGKRAEEARAMFEKEAANHGLELVTKSRGGTDPSAMWIEAQGNPAHVLPVVGRTADLIVVSRPHSTKSKMAHAFLKAAVLETGRPVLVMPQKRHAHLTRHIGIAWNRSSEAARAVKLAMPLLQAAGKVTLYEVTGDTRLGPKAKDMAQYLAWHGVRAKVRVLRGKGATEHVLIEELQADEVDAVVMGAYSHARLMEVVFSGVSQFMLYEARMPVFVVH